MPHNTFGSVVLGLLGAAAIVAQADAGSVWTTFDPPGSITTYAYAVSAHNLIVGTYYDSNSYAHGYLRTADGTITPIDEPDADPNTDTTALGVDTAGNVMGSFVKSGGALGYVRKADGTFTSFQYKRLHTFPVAMNSRGVIVSFTFDDGGHVFLRKPNGAFVALLQGMSAVPAAINKYNVVTGTALSASHFHGFVASLTGGVTTFDPPGSTSTQPVSINASGTIAGTFTGSDGVYHGFLRAPDGTIATFDAPGAGTTQSGTGTTARNMDDNSNVVGCVVADNYQTHGFVRDVAGTMHMIDVPGSSNSCVTAIGASGKLFGYGDSHGFRALAKVWERR